jgi:putative salt-induced outer membrane protein
MRLSNLLLLMLPITVIADDTPWTNEVELGFLLNRGNTHNSHFDSRFTNKYDIARISNTFSVSSLVDLGVDSDTREKKKTAEKYSLLENVKLKFTDKDYIFGQIDGQRDKFSAFDYEVTESMGYGRKLINNDHFKWHLEAGPGGKHTRATRSDFSKTHQDELIGHAGSILSYMLSNTAELSEDITYDIGQKSQKTKSTTALKAKVFDKVSLKLSYLIEYNAKLPDTGKVQNHTDTTTALTATYMF